MAKPGRTPRQASSTVTTPPSDFSAPLICGVDVEAIAQCDLYLFDLSWQVAGDQAQLHRPPRPRFGFCRCPFQ